jgi:hypothetical protein
MIGRIHLVAFLAIAFFASPALADTKKASEPKNVTVTVYRTVGVVKEERDFDLIKGLNEVSAEGVSRYINQDTIIFQSLTKPDSVKVEEQSLLTGNVYPSNMIERSLGKTVTVKQMLGNGQTNEITGTLMFGSLELVPDSGHYILRVGDNLVMGLKGQIQVPLPSTDLVAKPELRWKLNSTETGKQNCQITYTVNNLRWDSSYIAVVDSSDQSIGLDCWVKVANSTGFDFKNVNLELVSGMPHQAPPIIRHARFAPAPNVYDQRVFTAGKMAMAPMEVGSSSEELEGYHLYKFPRTSDLSSSDTKQLNLFTRKDIPLQKKFVADSNYMSAMPPTPEGGQLERVQIDLEFVNDEKSHLGLPMPGGTVSVYKKDQSGSLQFIGADNLKDTPKAETVRLQIGDAFDLIAERKELAAQQVSKQIRKNSYEVDLRNHKDKEETITIVEHANGDWKINSSSHPYVKKNSTTFEFAIKVGANSEETLTYEIQTKSR